MNPLDSVVGIGAGFVSAATFWGIAARVARRRGIVLGTRPSWLLAGGGAVAGAAVVTLGGAAALPACAVLIGAAVCGIVDARTGLIFDALSATVAGAAGAGIVLDHRLADGACASAAVGAALLTLYFATGRRGIGLGDVKLGAAVALGLGLQGGLVAIGSAFVLGALYGLGRIGLGSAQRTDALRFGPFIAGGAAVSLGAGMLGWRA